jgi:short-subunit dehydrogenase
MNLALLDRDSGNLSKAAKDLASTSPKIEAYDIDVASHSQWQEIASKVSSAFGSVDLLMLNAGHGPKPATSSPWLDMDYFHKTLDVNLYGVINGINTFLPLVRKSSGPSAIVITGSKQGITNPPGNPAYNASKSAVKTLAEHLSHDLRTSSNPMHSPHTSVHLLVPGWTFTGLSGNIGPSAADSEEVLAKKPKGAWLPSQCAEYGVKGIKAGKFYLICPDNDVDEALDQARMTWQMGDVVEGRSALSRWDELFKEDAAAWIAEEARKRREGGSVL